MMRSAIFDGPGLPLTIRAVPVPEPGHGEVLIRVRRCGLCGTDRHLTEASPFAFPAGSALGHEYVGEIVQQGAECGSWEIGERIVAMPVVGCGTCLHCLSQHPFRCPEARAMMGGFSDFARVSARSAARLPDSISWSNGALVEPLAAALHGVSNSAMKVGSRVLVIGAGLMGMGAAFWSRRMGAGRIVVTARSAGRGEMATSMGADAYLRSDEIGEGLDHILGGPPDMVFECSGAPAMIERAIDLVGHGGSVTVMSGCVHRSSFVSMAALLKEVCIRFSCAYRMTEFEVAINTLRVFDLAKTLVTKLIALNDLPVTISQMGQKNYQCKIMVSLVD